MTRIVTALAASLAVAAALPGVARAVTPTRSCGRFVLHHRRQDD